MSASIDKGTASGFGLTYSIWFIDSAVILNNTSIFAFNIALFLGLTHPNNLWTLMGERDNIFG